MEPNHPCDDPVSVDMFVFSLEQAFTNGIASNHWDVAAKSDCTIPHHVFNAAATALRERHNTNRN
jgi:hypothetical protein